MLYRLTAIKFHSNKLPGTKCPGVLNWLKINDVILDLVD